MPDTAGNVYLFEHMQVWRVNSSGQAVGQADPDNFANGATSHAYKLKGPVTANLPQIGYLLTIFKAGGTIQGQADTGVDTIGTFEITLADLDATLSALVQGGLVDTTSLTNATIFGMNDNNPSPNDIGLMLTARYQGRASTPGVNEFLSVVFPLCQARLRLNSISGEGGVNPNPITMTVTPRMASKFPNAVAFAANQGWYDNKSLMYFKSAQWPYSLTVFKQDGVDDTYVTGYRGKSSAVATGNTTNWFTIGGTPTAPTSYDPATGVVTLAAAGSAAVIATALYQTGFVAI
jgi:hypothetical protein